MKPQTPPSELTMAFEPLRPTLYKAILFSFLISMLALAPTVYMLEVYDRVVNSRNGTTLAMLTIFIVPPTPATTEEQLRKNPLGIFIRDFSWSRQQQTQ